MSLWDPFRDLWGQNYLHNTVLRHNFPGTIAVMSKTHSLRLNVNERRSIKLYWSKHPLNSSPRALRVKTGRKKKIANYLRMSSMKQLKLLILLNHNPYVHVSLIFYVTKWEVHIQHWCWILSRIVTYGKRTGAVWFASWTTWWFFSFSFLNGTPSLLEIMVIQIWRFDRQFFWTWPKWTYHFKETNW